MALVRTKPINNAYLGRKYVPAGSFYGGTRVLSDLGRSRIFKVASLSCNFSFSGIIRHGGIIIKRLETNIRNLLQRGLVGVIYNGTSFGSRRAILISNGRCATSCVVVTANSISTSLPVPNTNLPKVLASHRVLSIARIPRELYIVNKKIVKLRFTSIFGDFNDRIAIIRCYGRVLPHFSASLTGELGRALSGGKVRVGARTRILSVARRNSRCRIACSHGSGRRIIITSGMLVTIKHHTGMTSLGLDSVNLSFAPHNVIIGSTVRAGLSRICTVNSIGNEVVLTRTTAFRNVITLSRVVNIRGRVSLSIVPTTIFASPRTTDINGARSRYGRRNVPIGYLGSFFETGKGTIAVKRARKFYGFIISATASRMLNYRLFKPRTSSVIRRTYSVVDHGTAIRRFQNIVRARPALARILRSTLRSWCSVPAVSFFVTGVGIPGACMVVFTILLVYAIDA